MKSILDPSFPYVHSTKTDVSETFKRIRLEIEAEKLKAKANQQEAAVKVKPLIKVKA